MRRTKKKEKNLYVTFASLGGGGWTYICNDDTPPSPPLSLGFKKQIWRPASDKYFISLFHEWPLLHIVECVTELNLQVALKQSK